MNERLGEVFGDEGKVVEPSLRLGLRVEIATGYPSIGLLSSRA